MKPRVTPMIHVPDVTKTVDWYKSIGFTVSNVYDDGRGGLSFAILSFGDTQVMFNQGGHPSDKHRREVDLYAYTSEVDRLHEELKDRVDVVEEPHDTFYGMREFIIRDLNRFWITFGQESSFAELMSALDQGDASLVQAVLARNKFSKTSLTKALLFATGKPNNEDIQALLVEAGGVKPLQISPEILETYAGEYRSSMGNVVMVVKNGILSAIVNGQDPIELMPTSETAFKAIYFEDNSVTFKVQEGKTVGFTFSVGTNSIEYVRSK